MSCMVESHFQSQEIGTVLTIAEALACFIVRFLHFSPILVRLFVIEHGGAVHWTHDPKLRTRIFR